MAEEWITPKEAAYEARLRQSSFHRLCNLIDPITRRPYFKTRRPSARVLQIHLPSLKAHLAAVEADPLFWDLRQQKAKNFNAAGAKTSGLRKAK